jgi:hypothetical protein
LFFNIKKSNKKPASQAISIDELQLKYLVKTGIYKKSGDIYVKTP